MGVKLRQFEERKLITDEILMIVKGFILRGDQVILGW